MTRPFSILVPNFNHVCKRYRIDPYLDVFQEFGLEPNFLYRDQLSLAALRKIRNQPLLIQRELLSPWLRLALRGRHAPLLFDLDDAIWQRDSYAKNQGYSRKLQTRFRAMMHHAHLVIAGNAFLADQASKLTDATVHVIPTCIDLNRYPTVQSSAKKPNPAPVLIWIGSSSTLKGLEGNRSFFEKLGQQLPNLELRIICDRFPQLEHVRVVNIPWSSATEVAELQSAYFGISWIPDDTWSRGKCGLKVLQYLAAGLPVLANPVGVHPAMVQSGHNGLLSERLEDWVGYLTTATGPGNTYLQQQQHARQTIVERYSTEVGKQQWRRVLQTMLLKN